MKISDPKKIEKIVSEIFTDIATQKDAMQFIDSVSTFSNSIASSGLEAIAISLRLTLTEKKVQIWDKLEQLLSRNIYLEKLIVRLLDHNLVEYLTAENFELVRTEIVGEYTNYTTYTFQVSIEFASNDIQQIRAKLSQQLNTKIFLKVQLKPNILGGFILIKGNKIIDASVQRELEDYRARWVTNLNATLDHDNF